MCFKINMENGDMKDIFYDIIFYERKYGSSTGLQTKDETVKTT